MMSESSTNKTTPAVSAPSSSFFYVSSSSHVRTHTLTSHIMRDVVIAMIPASLFGVYRFGLHAIFVILATVASCVLSEYLYQKWMKLPIRVGDLSAVVTGLILALNMPPQIPLWIPILGGIFAIVVIKQVYGGIGFNWMNPALGARCFLLISFANKMTDFTSTGYDAVSGPTPLGAMRELLQAGGHGATRFSLSDMFLGNIPGTIGEVSALALLLGAAYLLIRKVISWRIPFFYLLSFSVFILLFGAFDIYFLMYHLLGGGLLFGVFFMATDYTTSPITPKGQMLFGIFLGLLTGIFRLFGSGAEGVSYAIIIGNIVAPLLEKYSIPLAFGKEKKR